MSETISISRPPDEVFEFIADLRNFPLWRANLASSTVISERPSGVGARCDEEIQMGARKIPATCEITTFSAGRSYSFRAISRGLVYDGNLAVEGEAGGSSLTLTGEVRPGGLLRLLEPMLRRRMAGGVKSEVAAIKNYMESH